MRKRKPTTASKRAVNAHKPATRSKGSSRPRVAARAQRNKQAIVRGPKDNRTFTGSSPELSVEALADQKQENSIVENRAAALQAISLSAPQDGFSQKVKETSDPKKGFEVSSLTSNIQACQAKLLEVSQANVQFVLEFAQRLASIRSPLEFNAVIAEFTGRRILMIGKHSREMTAALTGR